MFAMQLRHAIAQRTSTANKSEKGGSWKGDAKWGSRGVKRKRPSPGPGPGANKKRVRVSIRVKCQETMCKKHVTRFWCS